MARQIHGGFLEVAFRGHVISEAEHPVIKRLQGRA